MLSQQSDSSHLTSLHLSSKNTKSLNLTIYYYLYHVYFPAYALSSNYNFEPGFGSGYDTMQQAVIAVDGEDAQYSDIEKDLIRALAHRSSAESKAAVNPAEMFFGKLDPLSILVPVYRVSGGNLAKASVSQTLRFALSRVGAARVGGSQWFWTQSGQGLRSGHHSVACPT